MRKSEKGIALLIVLWVMAILMATVLSFTMMTRAETYGTLAFKENMEEQFLAEAGVERGIAEIINRSLNIGQTVVLEGKEVWRVDGTAYKDKLEKGNYQVRIVDESGKISLNSLTDASGVILNNLLVSLGSSPEDAAIIVDSILDWKDEDDLRRLNGAENDYYQSLKRPYKARNADFESLEELLLVKGMTAEILYGEDGTPGLINFISLYNSSSTININVAPKELLAALPGMDDSMAERIIEMRNEAEIKNLADIKGIIGDVHSLLAQYVSVEPGGASTCTIEATGYNDSEGKGYSIRATVEMQGQSKHRYLYYHSPAERLLWNREAGETNK